MNVAMRIESWIWRFLSRARARLRLCELGLKIARGKRARICAKVQNIMNAYLRGSGENDAFTFAKSGLE